MKPIVQTLIAVWFIFGAALPPTLAGLKAGDVDPKNGKVIKYWVAPMDPTYIRKEPGKSPMGMDLVPVYQEKDGEKLPESTIKIDPVTEQDMGVRTATVKRMALTKSIRALGTVTYDETRIYAVNLKFDGWIEKLYVNFVGESVTRGQPLFDIYSPELYTTQQEYLLAESQAASLAASTYPSVRENADRLLQAARQRLEYWDLEEKQIRQLKKKGTVKKNITVYSPATGVVIQKDALAGHFVKAGMHQYEIADLSRVWVDVEVYEYELPFVKKEMPAGMELSYLPGKHFAGTVLFIYPYLNPQTRTVKLRLAFNNPEGLLKPEMYANVYLQSLIDPAALVIPQEAVIDSGLRKVVFVALGDGKYAPRKVTLGVEGEHNTFQVLDGLKEGDTIVTSAQFLFDSESRLREAIQKMLEPRSDKPLVQPSAGDLDMSKMKMDDSDLDMSNLKMDK
ncbi:efflux RND transporter periplasmic adaptor subunit [Desulfopila sp. IMCC35006]|uniref:efflux RND transporter periplasmic adaptor subunit n=1 Tax=Desulfopila sp. IMCC35006 TaxID=2569542 RepID=UPI0010ACB2A6|nr:efflux RND transporter periplasmic adaptor subunit [Desulfopila sp. IMCC35006]TKB28075.1 efflux RND transporter periplasmic adaptor subunit [Desulfopila sp. IMCC35006]